MTDIAGFTLLIPGRLQGIEAFRTAARPGLGHGQSQAGSASAETSGSRGALTLEPVTIPMKYLEVESEIYLEILKLPDQKVVTIVELLSPSNKAGAGRRDYLAKRHGLTVPDVHLVELDFLIGGHRLPMEHPLPPGEYYALIARAERRPDWDVFAWTVRDPLPVIPIPLLPPDSDVLIDLAPSFASVYDRGRDARLIKYDAPLDVPLAPEDRDWAEKLARTKH